MSAPRPVKLPAAVAERIRHHCEEQYPCEACGAIFGRGDGTESPWLVTGVAHAPNDHDDDHRRRYLVPPEFQLHAEQEARAAGLDVLGYYHSHPDHPARPSEYDRAHAWLGYLYVICAVAEGRAAAMNAFTLAEPDGAFVDVVIEGDAVAWRGPAEV
ncbi:MAG: M67 family metallopeptidase [Deltaproteobacteria bacterium]|nr:M67 family metallopeptidase [Deltaproteobacteria bacterium]